ncbi:MAG TPA: signal recognition particle protein [Candidatus Azoamicus sp. OHIO1]
MLEALTLKLSKILLNISGKYKLSDSNLKDVLKDVRKSLIEADVSWEVVKFFINNVKDKAIGMEVINKISPSNIFIKIVYDELINLLIKKDPVEFISNSYSVVKPAVILLIGLQGVGKTTTVVKLARWIKLSMKKSVSVVSCDIYRPAAIEQLRFLSNQNDIDCYSESGSDNLLSIISGAVNYFKYKDFLLVDTAGRLHIDDFMMNEINNISNVVCPTEILLVVDSMSGQDALKSARMFNEVVPISGFIVTKMDSDTRGGVILSLSHIMKKPIIFLGVGEKVDAFEYFYPERLVSRILGMGDLTGLLEDVTKNLDENKIKEFNKRVGEKSDLDLNDFRDQLLQMLKLGGLKVLVDKIPGMAAVSTTIKDKISDKDFLKMISIMSSMTIKERRFPLLINGSRKRRIANGSGTDVQSINRLLKQFFIMQKMWRKHSNKSSVIDLLKNKLSFFNNV